MAWSTPCVEGASSRVSADEDAEGAEDAVPDCPGTEAFSLATANRGSTAVEVEAEAGADDAPAGADDAPALPLDADATPGFGTADPFPGVDLDDDSYRFDLSGDSPATDASSCAALLWGRTPYEP
ncbi:hypothetical protein GCM10023083_70470 [Streptomyces phyllanthi]